MHQWTNWELVFSAWSMGQLCGAIIEELFGGVFSVRSVLRCFKQDRFRVQLVVRQSPASKDVNIEVE
jgi:hypothetical protein